MVKFEKLREEVFSSIIGDYNCLLNNERKFESFLKREISSS